MQMVFCNGNDKVYQHKLNHLLRNVFFDFQFWYDLGLWDENYESYAMEDNVQIVSNICVYKTQLLADGRVCPALSIGAVATDAAYRSQGLSRTLMERILEKYKDRSMYLFANETVLEFYPRFGFERIRERLPVAEYAIDNDIAPCKLRFDSELVRQHVYNRQNHSQTLDCLNTASINLFHIFAGHLKEHIYHIPALETVVIAAQNEETLKISAVFSLRPVSFAELARQLPVHGVRKIEWGFMPCWEDLVYDMVDAEGDPFFVRGLRDMLCGRKFPELAAT